MDKFFEAGKEAHANGKMRAPVFSAIVRDALEGLPVGDPRVMEIMKSFTDGFDAATEAELAAILAED